MVDCGAAGAAAGAGPGWACAAASAFAAAGVPAASPPLPVTSRSGCCAGAPPWVPGAAWGAGVAAFFGAGLPPAFAGVASAFLFACSISVGLYSASLQEQPGVYDLR